MPMLAANTNPAEVAAAYCMNMVNIAPAHDHADVARVANFATPVPDIGNNLATFIGNRLSMSFGNLNCGDFGLTDPTNVTAGDDGVATAVTYNTAQQQATIPAPARSQHNGSGRNNGPARGYDRHHKFHSSGV
jgi:hypothetical protein